MPTPPLEPVQSPRYELGPPLGRGASGDVFEAWDNRLRRRVALKRLAAPDGTRPASAEETVREATHLAAAQHPNVVTVYDLSADELGPFMVMELVEGETLDTVVRRNVLTPETFLEVARQALEGLSAAHEAGLLHCDLKPANIMLKTGSTETLRVKLLDFGIASFSTEQDQPAAPKLGPDGKTTVWGTVEFMAPEHFEHAAATAQGDLYSLGCIFYYALTGGDPFLGRTIEEIMQSHLQHRVVPIGELREDLPAAIGEWIMRLIRRQAGERPASAAAALAELRAAVGGS